MIFLYFRVIMSLIQGTYTHKDIVDPSTVPVLAKDVVLIDAFKIHTQPSVVVDITKLEVWEFQRDTREAVVDTIVKDILVCWIQVHRVMGAHNPIDRVYP